MKFRRAKKLGLAQVTLTNKGASVSRVKLKELAKAELRKSEKSKGGSKAKSPAAETAPLKRVTKKKVLPSRVSTVAISGDVPAEWKLGSGVFEGLFWTGKKWVKVKPNASDAAAAVFCCRGSYLRLEAI
jgi:hypothetical protein